jgi:hypothetical protein
MWPATQRYFDTLARSHDQIVKIDILKQGSVYVSLNDGFIIDPNTGKRVSTIGGSISVDKTTIRRNGNVVFIDPSGQLLPDSASDLFAPYVTEIRAWVGVRYWDAYETEPLTSDNSEYVPVGTLVITNPTNSFPQLTMNGYDRMWYLDNFQSPYTIPAGTKVSQAITDILTLKVPGGSLQYNIPDTTEFITSALIYDADTSSADAVFNLAQNSGYQLYCDPMGIFQMTDEPTTNDAPVMTYARGAFSMLNRPTRDIGSSQMYNAVVVTSEGSTTAPVRGFAQDDNPDSLTYVGSVGVHPMFISDPSILTQGQADVSAGRHLKAVLGVSDTTAVPIFTNHALESGDVINVTDDQQNLSENLLVDSFTVPFRASDGLQNLTCRSNVLPVLVS